MLLINNNRSLAEIYLEYSKRSTDSKEFALLWQAAVDVLSSLDWIVLLPPESANVLNRFENNQSKQKPSVWDEAVELVAQVGEGKFFASFHFAEICVSFR